MSGGIEERLRNLEIGYTKISSRMDMLVAGVSDMKETLKELTSIAKSLVKIDTQFKAYEDEKKNMCKRIEELEREIAWLKKIAYGAMLIATIVAPVIIEWIKRSVLK